jgi:hypothetical protein
MAFLGSNDTYFHIILRRMKDLCECYMFRLSHSTYLSTLIILSYENVYIVVFRNKFIFYGVELLAPRPTPKLEDHTLSAVRDCLFNIFAATLQNWRESSIRNLRTRHAVVTRYPPTIQNHRQNYTFVNYAGGSVWV